MKTDVRIATRTNIRFNMPRLYAGLLLFQLITGLLLWVPFFTALLFPVSLWLTYIHVMAGFSLPAVMGIGLWRLRPVTASGLKDVAEAFAIFPLSNQPRWITTGLFFSVQLLTVSGMLMAPGKWMPVMPLSIAIYLHGTGFLLFLPLLLVSLYIATARYKKRPQPTEPNLNWLSASPGTKYRLSNLITERPHQQGRRFIDAFGAMLKHSKLPLLLENYPTRKDNPGPEKQDKHSGNSLIHTATPGQALALLYRRHFGPSAWFAGKASGIRTISKADIEHFTKLCYSYRVCAQKENAGEMESNEALMAKFGRFLLSQTGIMPAEINTARLQKEIHATRGVRVPVSINKQDAEVLFVPAVHDYSGQSDTLRGMITLLHASGMNWTLSNLFFDGLNYGTFFGSWFVDSILDKFHEISQNSRVKRIVLGGCSGVAYKDKAKGILSANDFVLEALAKGNLNLDIERLSREVIGFSGFCDSGCYLTEKSGAYSILKMLSEEIVTIGISGNRRPNYDKDILKDLMEKHVSVLIAPYHNSRERLKSLVKSEGLPVKVYGLYELLGSLVSLEGGK